MSERTIGEDVLRGIAAALQRHAPQLVPVILRLLSAGEIQTRSSVPGNSAHGKLTGSVTPAEGQAVLGVLRAW